MKVGLILDEFEANSVKEASRKTYNGVSFGQETAVGWKISDDI